MTTNNNHDDQHEDRGTDGAADADRRDNVVYLPANNDQHDDPAAHGVVLDGELVPDSERSPQPQARETFNTRRMPGLVPEAARERMAEGAVVLSRRAAPVAKSGGKAVVRHGAYVIAGAGVVAKRVRDAHTSSRYERMMTRLEAEGDWDRMAEWEQRSENAKDHRHRRAMDWLDAPMRIAKAFAVGALALIALLFAVGVVLAIDSGDGALILDPLAGLVDVVRWSWWFAAAYGALMLCALSAAVVAYLWQQGRARGELPRWASGTADAPAGEDRDSIPDEGAILTALRHLGIRELNEQIKKGWQPRWVSGTGRVGKGWHSQLQLPLGVPVEEIVKRKTKLAHNLMRTPVEVWPTEPRDQPTVLDLWVADRGALSGPVDAWPLLSEGSADYFKGVPVGMDIRGRVITGRLFEANYGIAGMMGSGKSTLVITLIAGAILDVLVEVDVFVFAENADYDQLEPRLRNLTTGADPENITACMELLRNLFAETAVRGRALQEHGERKVTRKLAEQDPRLRPRVVVIDECQNLFLSAFGEEAEELCVKLITTARKYAITLVFLTPEPSTDSLPRKLVTILSNKACFAIGDQQSNDAILGTGSYKAGISAVNLEPMTTEGPGDVGTAMARGFQPRPGLMRSFYLRKEAGIDEVTPVVQRALALREGADLTAATDTTPDPADVADPMADIAEVIAKTAARRMRTQEVLQRLAEHNPGRYRDWTFGHLAECLADTPAAPYKSDGYMVISAARLAAAITERDHDAEGGGQGPAREAGRTP